MFSLGLYSFLMLTFAVCTGLSAYLWRSRHSAVHRLVIFTQLSYALWAFLVLGTMIVPDLSGKIILTQARQLFLPLVPSAWLLILCAIFYRPLWDKMGRWRYLILVFPVIVVIGHLFTILGLPFAATWSFHDFSIGDNPFGLLQYKMGWLISLNFVFGRFCIIGIYLCYLVVLFTQKGLKRKYALLLIFTSSLHIANEILSRAVLKDLFLVQTSVAFIWPAALALFYAVSRLELLDIGVLAKESIFENLPSPILICDTHGWLWSANASAYRTLGLNKSHVGRPLNQIPLVDKLSPLGGHIEINTEIYQVVQQEVSLKDGEEKARVYILNNITDLQESKNALQNLNDQILGMINFNRRVQAILSHDLTGSLAGLQLLLKGIQAKLAITPYTDLQKEVAEISQAQQSSLELLRNILAWSHKEENSDQVGVIATIQASLKHLAPQILGKRIQIKEAFPETEVYLSGSRKIFESILRNLLSNAIRFSPLAGEIEIQIQKRSDLIQIYVTDHGSGISQEKIEQILSGQRTQSDPSGGFGLGLTFTLDFIKQLQGQLEIESTVGKGSRFILTLPLV